MRPQSATPVVMTENPLTLRRKVSTTVAYSMISLAPVAAACTVAIHVPDTFGWSVTRDASVEGISARLGRQRLGAV